MDSDDLFAQELDGVVPIKNDRVEITKKMVKTPGIRVRRKLAVGSLLKEDPLASFEVPPLKSNDVLEFKRPGIQNGVFKKFRLGHYEIDARLDLHQLSVEEARREVFRFVRECFDYELRTAIILHGKGDRNPDKIAILKSHLAIWLPQIDEVLAFHSAQRHHGGTGAVYVLLKKGSKAKQLNRESLGMK